MKPHPFGWILVLSIARHHSPAWCSRSPRPPVRCALLTGSRPASTLRGGGGEGVEGEDGKRTVKLTLAYQGTAYNGWQSQTRDPRGAAGLLADREDGSGVPGKRRPKAKRGEHVKTVQDTLEEAIWRLTGEVLRTRSCSRTDAGVHALGHVATFSTASPLTDTELVAGLNTRLPRDVVVTRAETAPPGFDPRGARRKMYRYLVSAGGPRPVFGRELAWHVGGGQLDVGAMRRAAGLLVGGPKDFASFCNSKTLVAADIDTFCALDAITVSPRSSIALHEEPPSPGGGEGGRGYVVIEVVGARFLHNMVRIIAGLLVEVGRGGLDPGEVGRVLEARDRAASAAAANTAPACGLSLVWVEY